MRRNKALSFLLVLTILATITSITLAQEESVSEYVDQLKYKEASARAYAAYVLGEIGDKSAVNSLVPLLNDENKYVRAIVAEALGKIQDTKAVEALTTALKDEDRIVRVNAAKALKMINPSKQYEIARYVEDLNAKNASIRKQAARKLSELVPEKAQQYQMIRYKNDLNDQDAQIRASAASSLGEIGNAEAVPPLIEALNDSEALVRRNAAVALGQIILRLKDDTVAKPAVEPLISLLKDKSEMVSESAANTLTEIGEPAVQSLVSAVNSDNAKLRATAVKILGKIHPENLQEYQISRYIKGLNDQDVYVRANAATQLGMIGDEQAVEPLIVALRDVDSSVRQNAKDALVDIGEPAIRPLVPLLKEQDASVKLNAAIALKEISLKLSDVSKLSPAKDAIIDAFVNPDSPINLIATEILKQMDTYVVDSLTTLLSSEDGTTRAMAVKVLSEIQPQKTRDYKIMRYMNELDSPNASVRAEAANALGVLGGTNAVGGLINLLGDNDDSVRRCASDALEKIGQPAIKPLIAALTDDDLYTRKYAFTTLAEIAPEAKVDDIQPAITPAIEGLRDIDSSIRLASEEILVNIGEPSIRPIIDLFKSSDSSIHSRSIRILVRIGSPAVETLEAALNEPSSVVRHNAMFALIYIVPAQAKEYKIARYINDLKDTDAEVRKKAALRLGRINDSRAVEPLITALSDKNFQVRANAADSLAYLADRRAVEPLKRVEDDDKVDMVKRVAKESLERLERLPEND